MLAAILIFSGASNVWAQSAINDIPAEINPADATITKMGHLTMTIEKVAVFDSLTLRADTLVAVKNVEFDTASGTALKRKAQRKARAASGSGFENQDSNSWLDLWWFTYNYPSVDAEGNPITLSAMACMPDDDCSFVNNVIIGCHITIASNKECPSRYSEEGSSTSDVSMMMNHAGSGLLLPSTQGDMPYYNLVILPDYEGYGVTRDRAHPYLYQELTARQVVDGARYGIGLYKNDSNVDNIRHPFRNGWRTICLGYSQGGSVAMATQRFIEQNGLTDDFQLAGSVCGDGPYDLMSTVMYYVKGYKEGKDLTMPVVMPLILKGMCDSNPYMADHQVSDYMKLHFLETGILGWLDQKILTTEEITDKWKKQYKNGKPESEPDAQGAWGPDYYHSALNADGTSTLEKMMKDETLMYFSNLYDAYKDNFTSPSGIPLPTKRGLNEDLHFALESNNMTKGWQPQHPIILYHSYEDTVVPEVNRERADNTIGDWVIKVHASVGTQYDHVGTGRQFFLGTEEFNSIRALANASVHPTVEEVGQIRESFGNSVDD